MAVIVLELIIGVVGRVPAVFRHPLLRFHIPVVLQTHIERSSLAGEALRDVAAVEVPAVAAVREAQSPGGLSLEPEKGGSRELPEDSVYADVLRVVP